MGETLGIHGPAILAERGAAAFGTGARRDCFMDSSFVETHNRTGIPDMERFREALVPKPFVAAGALLLMFWTSAALAGGVNLSWNDCGAAGTATRTSACSNNALAGTLYCTAIPPADMPRANGQTCTVDVQTTGTSLSPWWHMEYSSGCAGRAGSALACSMDFSSDFGCNDPWQGQASSAGNFTAGFGGPSRARLRGTGAIAGITALSADNEWAICKLTIAGTRTAGAGACGGCFDGACLVLKDVLLTQPMGSGDYHITNALERERVVWQSAGGNISGCQVSTRAATWGSVKALYR